MFLDRVRNWNAGDGSIRTTFYLKGSLLKKGDIHPITKKVIDHDETEQEMIERADFGLQPLGYDIANSTLDKLSDLPLFKDQSKWRRNVQGGIFIDHSIETKPEKESRIKGKLRVKFAQLGLTQDEIEMLLK